MTDPRGVNLLPASGEWVYDTLPHRAAPAGQAVPVIVNLNADPDDTRTDYSLAIDQLQAQYPGCTTVSLVVAWFGNATDVTRCAVYPTTNYIAGQSEVLQGGVWSPEPWLCSGLTQQSSGLIPLSTSGNAAIYGGTPSDPSVVRCIRDLKARGLRVVFYPFLLMDAAGYPWRGRIAFTGPDISGAASQAVARFLGQAVPSQFTRDPAALTVAYAGAPLDWTFRRMILHYANLCVLAGGVDMFLVGSEMRGLETIRGPAWTKDGVETEGITSWDYPFVDGLARLTEDVRSVFDGAFLTGDRVALKNLIAYSADWSSWMGVRHDDSSGQWPHLDQLFAHPAIDLVSFDNYLPLSDWTTGGGGLDTINWHAPAPSSWPPPPAAMNGLGLTGSPSLHDKAYLKANIEAGEKYNWFYFDSTNNGRGADPNGSDMQVSRPGSDRLVQNRACYQVGQELLANKKVRWWWHNRHLAIFDTGDGQGEVPRGRPTRWVPRSKSITFAEFGFPTCDRATNQPNVFYDPRSSESFTPYWSIWDPSAGARYSPRRDDLLARLARDAVTEYWTIDGRNETSEAGISMIEPTFMSAWNWDARPFPAFPKLPVWGDAPNWPIGTWIGGKAPDLEPPNADNPPATADIPVFPDLAGRGWAVRYRPVFNTATTPHVSGRETRVARNAAPVWEIELRFDRLGGAPTEDLAGLVSFYQAARGRTSPFAFAVPADLGVGPMVLCRFADDQIDSDEFAHRLFALKTLRLQSVRG